MCRTEVYQLVKKVETNLPPRLAAIQELDSKVGKWWNELPSSLDLSPDTIPLVPQDTLPLRLLVHVVYHQCLCALHSSIVPLFSWTSATNGYSYARQVSAQIAYEHATAVSLLINSALQHSWDASRVPSFVGYAGYCSSAILIPFIWCIQPDIRERARLNVLANLTMIRLLGRYWKFIGLLVSRILVCPLLQTLLFEQVAYIVVVFRVSMPAHFMLCVQNDLFSSRTSQN